MAAWALGPQKEALIRGVLDDWGVTLTDDDEGEGQGRPSQSEPRKASAVPAKAPVSPIVSRFDPKGQSGKVAGAGVVPPAPKVQKGVGGQQVVLPGLGGGSGEGCGESVTVLSQCCPYLAGCNGGCCVYLGSWG